MIDPSSPPIFSSVIFFWTFFGQAFQQFLYWLVGQYTTDLSSLSRHTGILRGFEALGQTVAWALQSQAKVNHFVSIGLNFGILLLAIPPTWYVLSQLEGSHETAEAHQEASSQGTIEGQEDKDDLKASALA